MASSDFRTDTARALPGPAWLSARRTAAAEALGDLVLPSTDAEVWRYSRVADLDLDHYTPGGADAPPTVELQPAAAGFGGRVVLVDGVVAVVELAPRLAAAGVFVGRLVDHPDAAALLGSVLTEPTDVFAHLNDAFSVDPIAIVVPPGVVVEQPIVVEHVATRADLATFPRIVVRAGANSAVTVLDSQQSREVAALVLPVVELHAGHAARIGFGTVQQLGARTWQIASQVARAEADSTVVASTAALGGEYARVRTDCRLVGAGATGDLVSLYFGNGDQTLDFRTFQDHAAPNTTSNLLFKGVVDDRSRSVYTGLIRVRKNAHGTNAFQTNRNLKLSDDAWAESVPNLEIENNDVHCSHASTVGPIDEDQRFYLESRGVPPEAAERLVVAGFFADVFDRLPVASAVPTLRAAIAAKLDAHGAQDARRERGVPA
jgi:Fe-S cluster assembly protein SufD